MVNDAKGGTVYRDHLPLLGEQGPGRSAGHGWSIGDQVSPRDAASAPIRTHLKVEASTSCTTHILHWYFMPHMRMCCLSDRPTGSGSLTASLCDLTSDHVTVF